MKKTLTIAILLGLGNFIISCQNQDVALTESQKKEIIDAAKVTVQKVFEHSNNLEFKKGLNYYLGGSNSFYVSDGTILSLEELKTSYDQIGPAVEILNNSIASWNATVLSSELVAFTLPVRLKFKLRGIPEYNGQLVWSGILQNIDNNWMIVQSHESWLNCAEVAAALTPTDEN